MSNVIVKIELPRHQSGTLLAHVWPGGYPLYYVTQDGGVLCPDCARNAESEGLTGDPDDPQWDIIAYDANWEDTELCCDHCSKHIVSAYGDD